MSFELVQKKRVGPHGARRTNGIGVWKGGLSVSGDVVQALGSRAVMIYVDEKKRKIALASASFGLNPDAYALSGDDRKSTMRMINCRSLPDWVFANRGLWFDVEWENDMATIDLSPASCKGYHRLRRRRRAP